MGGDTPALQFRSPFRGGTEISRTHFVSSRGLKPRDLTFAHSSHKLVPARFSVRSFAVFAAQDDDAADRWRVVRANEESKSPSIHSAVWKPPFLETEAPLTK